MGSLFSPDIPAAPVQAAAPVTSSAAATPGSLELPSSTDIGNPGAKKKKFTSEYSGLKIPTSTEGAV